MDQTIRFRADTPLAYAFAVARVTEYAREHDDEFEFGPLDLTAMKHSGLVVTGPDLEGVTRLLAGVPGVVEAAA